MTTSKMFATDTLPRYDIIDQVEKPMDVDRLEKPIDILRYDAIKIFLNDFFKDWKSGDMRADITKSCRKVILQKRLYSIDIKTLNLTAFTFEESLHRMCKEVFRHTYKLGYFVSLLSFAIELDNHLQDKSWYQTQRLIEVLVLELIKTPFNPDNINIEEEDKKYSMFLLIIPVLFMTYFLCT